MYKSCFNLSGNIQNYDEMSLLCNKIEFAVFNIKNITERYHALVSEEKIVKARQLVTEQELRSQETLNFCKSFLENIDNDSVANSQNSVMDQFLETLEFNVKNSKKRSQKVPWDLNTHQKVLNLRPVHLTLWWNSAKVSLGYVRTKRKLKYLQTKLKNKLKES